MCKVTINRTPPVMPVITGYTLDLTPKEAGVLVKILNNIGGLSTCPWPDALPARGHSNAIFSALATAGVAPLGRIDGPRSGYGSIYFTDDAV